MQTLIPKLESILGVKKSPSVQERELFKKTRDFVSFITWIPGLRMVAVSNSLAMYATHPDSDIDLFIVTAPRRLWLVRTLILGIAMILGVRTRTGDEAGKFCFPFLITERNLSLQGIALENDIYLAYWISTLKPIYNSFDTYGRFLRVNEWVNISINKEENEQYLLQTRDSDFGNVFILSTLLDWIDSLLGKISRWSIDRRVRSSLGKSNGIVVSDDMLKLHYDDKRGEMREKVVERVI
ncbi:MAG: hypothetical protein Q8K26_03060 [Candidatus Gracilibacteria bacterium]|nr:hypothetical protein [Candidatus Gracilibacteria bacterium]